MRRLPRRPVARHHAPALNAFALKAAPASDHPITSCMNLDGPPDLADQDASEREEYVELKLMFFSLFEVFTTWVVPCKPMIVRLDKLQGRGIFQK